MLAGGSPRCLRGLEARFQLQRFRHSPLQQQPSSRPFHSSRPNLLFEFLEPVSQTIAWGFQELHTQTTLPWFLTIPLGASIIRMTWTPVQLWTSHSREKRKAVTQLISAWRKAYQETARIKFPSGTEADAKRAEGWVIAQLKARKTAIQRHEKYVAAWVEPMLTISFIPIWILSMDCIRRMAGDTRTVLSLFKKDSDAAVSNLAMIEPGFQTESLFWVPNLVSGDPLWILPVTYGVLATYSVWTRVKDNIRRPKSAKSTFLDSKTFNYAMLAIPSVFTFMIIRSDMATALVLYLIGTTTTVLVQRPLIARVLGTTTQTPTLHAKQAKPKPVNGK